MFKARLFLLFFLLTASSAIFANSPKFFISLTQSFAQHHLNLAFQGQNLSQDSLNLYGFSEPHLLFLEGQAQLNSKFWYKRFLDPEQKLLILDIVGNFKMTFALVFQEDQLLFQNPKLKQLKIEKQPELEKTFIPVLEEFFRQLVIWDDQEKIQKEYGWTVEKLDVLFQKQLMQIHLNDDDWKPKSKKQTMFSIHEDSFKLILQKWNPNFKIDIAPNLKNDGLLIQTKTQNQMLALKPVLKNQEDQLLLYFQSVNPKQASPLDSLQIPLPFSSTSQIPQVSQTIWQKNRLTIYFQ